MLTVQGTNFYQQLTAIITNKTGVAMVVGGVYALDISAIDASSTTPDVALGNAVAVAAGNIRGFLCVAPTAIAIGASGQVIIRGRANILVDGTTAVAKGDKLKPTAASTALTKHVGGQLVMPNAIALAAQAVAAPVLTDCLFNGENWQCELAAS